MEGKGVGLVTVPLPWFEFMRWRSGKSGALVEHFIDTQIKIRITNCCKRRISKRKILNDATIDVIILPSPLTGKMGIYS